MFARLLIMHYHNVRDAWVRQDEFVYSLKEIVVCELVFVYANLLNFIVISSSYIRIRDRYS